MVAAVIARSQQKFVLCRDNSKSISIRNVWQLFWCLFRLFIPHILEIIAILKMINVWSFKIGFTSYAAGGRTIALYQSTDNCFVLMM